MPSRARCIAFSIAPVLFAPSNAMADAGEPGREPPPPIAARVHVAGAPCVDDETFRERLAERGRAVVAPAPTDEASSIDVVVERCAPFGQDVYIGRLCLRDAAVGEVTRSTAASDCGAVVDSLATFVDDALAGRIVTPQAERLPERPRRRPGRAGGGGVAVSYMGLTDPARNGAASPGVRALVATYSGKRRAPRLGGAAAVTAYDDRLTTARLGGLIGWGAPWNDVVVGVIAEAGAMAVRTDALTPYAGLSFVFQIPMPFAVRPVVGFSTYWTPLLGAAGYDYPLLASGEVGVVWQAW